MKRTVRYAFWQRCVKAFVRILIGAKNQKLYDTFDWEAGCHAIYKPDLTYPQYYRTSNFHGIKGGYLNREAAVTYDAVTALASPPNETWLRQQVLTKIVRDPECILDLGCGTGSMTIMLKAAYPNAQVIGLDLSPHMLCMAQKKSQKNNLDIQWLHGLAEQSGLAAHSFDVITVCMVFHEMPPHISKLVLRECHRLVKPEGQVIILDGNQNRLRHTDWLIKLFREPYSTAYAAGNVQEWMEEAQLNTLPTRYVGWIHQITTSTKPKHEERPDPIPTEAIPAQADNH